ncbi:hypothetical protein E4T56_gene7406, partial [Termitomyces sp. T112]
MVVADADDGDAGVDTLAGHAARGDGAIERAERAEDQGLRGTWPQIGLERGHGAVERPAEFGDHAAAGALHPVANARFGQQQAELLDQRLLRLGLARGAPGIERLIDVGEVEDVRTVQDGGAELD